VKNIKSIRTLAEENIPQNNLPGYVCIGRGTGCPVDSLTSRYGIDSVDLFMVSTEYGVESGSYGSSEEHFYYIPQQVFNAVANKEGESLSLIDRAIQFQKDPDAEREGLICIGYGIESCLTHKFGIHTDELYYKGLGANEGTVLSFAKGLHSQFLYYVTKETFFQLVKKELEKTKP